MAEKHQTMPSDGEIEAVPELEQIRSVSTNEDGIDIHAMGGESLDDMPVHYFRSWRFIGTTVGFVLGFQASYILVVSASNILYFYIDPDIGPSPNIIWVLVAYTLAQCATFPLVGRLSDLFGRRWFFIMGNVIAFVGLLIGSRASSVDMLIAGQVIAGLGSAFQQSCLSALPEIFPRKYRFLAIAIIVDSLAPLTVLLPIIAITICQNTEQSWRWIWYICSIMTFLSGVLLFFCYHPPRFDQLHKHKTKRQVVRDLDWIGVVMFVGSITVTLLGISWGGQVYPWKSAHVIAPLVVGPLVMIAFFLWEMRIPESSQVVPLYMVKNRNFVALMVCAAVASMIWYAVNVLSSQESSLLFGASERAAGWISCSQTIGAQLGGLLGGLLVHTIKFTKLQLIACSLVFTAFIGGLAGVTASDKAMFIAFCGISSGAVGYIEVVALAGAPMEAKDGDIGIATSIVASFRTLASSLATSIYVTVFTNKATTELPAQIIPAAVSSGLAQSAVPELLKALASRSEAALLAVPGITPTIIEAVAEAAKVAYKNTFQLVYLISLAFGGCAIIAALVSKPLDSQLNTSVARRLQHLEGPENADREVKTVSA